MGAEPIGANICTTTDRIEYDRISLFIYVIYVKLYTFIFIYIMEKLQISCWFEFCLPRGRFVLTSPGMGMGGTIWNHFETILRRPF